MKFYLVYIFLGFCCSGHLKSQILFQEDFANGIPANWTNSSGCNGSYWRHTYTGSNGANNQSLNSHTSNNGWIIADAEGQLFPNGLCHGFYFWTSAIDLSGASNAYLYFQQQFTSSSADEVMTVAITTDDFNSVDTTFNLNSSVLAQPNSSTLNPENMVFDISNAIINNPSNVIVAFYYGGSGAFLGWEIDDIRIYGCEPQVGVQIIDTICSGESFVFNGESFDTTGVYTQYNSLNGCTNIETLDLTVHERENTTIEVFSCDNFLWPTTGLNYNNSGVYIDSNLNTQGCWQYDSLILNIDYTDTSYTNISTCDNFIWNGTTYEQSGSYVYNTSSESCDSTAILNLIINNSSSNYINATSCGSYLLNGQLYNSSGTYTQTLTNVAGCDSIITLELTINSNDFDISFESSQQLFTSPPFAGAFSNTSPDLSNYTYTWYWGDGTSTTSNNATVFHEYLNNGLYTVTLEATNNSTGCTDQTTFTDYIYTTGGVSCTHSATILQSGPIDACDGQTVILSCNSDPNYSYQWRRNGIYISGNNNDSLLVTSSGSYAVIITENNCPVSSSEIIVSFTTSVPTPTIIATGSIQPCIGGSVTLDAGSGYDNYLWSTGGTSQTEVVSASGDYTVTVSDLSGCSLTSSVYTVNASFMQPQQVCIVGMDSLSNFNRVVWEKPISDGIDYFNVYKEGSAANVYDLIGSVPYDDTAVFVDVNSNTAVQAYRYKVSIVDTCGTESALGEFHKTIHLTINQGVGQTWNLIWNHYEGFGFPSYNIYRGTDLSNISLLTTIASNLNSYTDLNPPGGTGIYYQIEVVNTNGCDPLKATDYGVSRSNIATVEVVNNIELTTEEISISPNPTTNLITIQSESVLNNKFKIYDQQGREVMNGKLTGKNTEVSLGKLSRGTYTIQVDGNYKPAVIIKQ